MTHKKLIKDIFLVGAKDKLKRFKELLAQVETLDLVNADEESLVGHLAYNGAVQCLDYLIQQGANINTDDHPITLAAMRGHVKAFELLLNAGADLCIDDYHSVCLFEIALENNRIDWLEKLFANPVLAEEFTNDLELFAKANSAQAIEYLLAHGFDIHTINEAGETVFNHVLSTYESQRIDLFMSYVDKSKINSDFGYSVLVEALINEHEPLVSTLLEHDAPVSLYDEKYANTFTHSPLMAACQRGNEKAVARLLEKGADIFYTKLDRWSVLSETVSSENATILQTIVEAAQYHEDLKKNLKSFVTESFLEKVTAHVDMIAVLLKLDKTTLLSKKIWLSQSFVNACWLTVMKTNRVFLAKKLYKLNADITQRLPKDTYFFDFGSSKKDPECTIGYNAIMYATLYEHTDMLNWLWTLPFDYNHTSYNGDSLLILLAHDDSHAINHERLTKVVSHIKDINHTTHDGWSALTVAARYGAMDNAQYLLQHGAKVHIQSNKGYTPLIAAVRSGEPEMVALMIEHMPKNELPVAKNGLHTKWDGMTALDVAEAVQEVQPTKNTAAIITLLTQAGVQATGHINDELQERLDDRSNDAEDGESLPEGYIEKLVAQLALCIDNLDTQALLESTDEYLDDEDNDIKYQVLDWLYENLEEQRHIEYEEWKEYWGELPDLALFDELDIEEHYNSMDIMEKDDDGEYMSVMYAMPYVEYMNHFLQPKGYRIVSFNTENLYMLGLKDNAKEIEKLDNLLSEIGIDLLWHDGLSREECKKYIADNADSFF